MEGLLRFDENFQLQLEPKKTMEKPTSDALKCPKCNNGNVLKGKMAYGCSSYKTGCDFKVTFQDVRSQLGNQKVTKESVHEILRNSINRKL